MTSTQVAGPTTVVDPGVQDRMNDYWSTWAGEYDAHQSARLARAGEREAWARVWAAGLPSSPTPLTVLDAGTGTGHAAWSIASLGHRVTGIDLAPGMLAEARRKDTGEGNAPDFRLGDARDPDFAPGSFDAVVVRYALWTLRTPAEVLRRWSELLRPGGRLVAVDSLWFPEGLLSDPLTTSGGARMDDFRAAYAQAVPELPLAEATDIHAFARLVGAAGFVDVAVEELPEILELDRLHGVAEHHHLQMNYRITATRP